MATKKYAIFALIDRGGGAIIPHKLNGNYDSSSAAESNIRATAFKGVSVNEFVILPVYILNGIEMSGVPTRKESQIYVEKHDENDSAVPTPVAKNKNGLVM